MGCHIYIQNKVDKISVKCPWYRVAPNYGRKIATKEDFSKFLLENKESDDKSIQEATDLLLSALDGDAVSIEKIVKQYSNNLGFLTKKKETNEETAACHSQQFEVDRLKRFAMTQEKIDKFLEIFDEDNHFVYLG